MADQKAVDTGLRDQIFPQLSMSAKTLLLNIEARAGFQIPFYILAEKGPVRSEVSRRRTSVRLDETAGEIYFPRSMDPTEADFVHELLHLHLKWIEQWPGLALRTGTHPSIDEMDNQIEHLWIIPEMVRRGYQETQWRDEFASVLGKARLNINTGKPGYESLMRCWLVLSLALEFPDLKEECRLLLDQMRVLPVARELVDRVSKGRDNKRWMVRALVRATGIDRSHLVLRTYDIARRQVREEAV